MGKKINKKELLKTPKGTRDILPHDVLYWEALEKKASEVARAYGFKPIRTPHIEKMDIFTTTLGVSSDIVEKQMYAFKTRGQDQLVLRPEGTSPIMRAYFEHGMHTWPQPIMLHYSGSFFRHENPQRGRYREFGQFGAEILGEESSIADALIIRLSTLILEELGFKSYTVNLNTLGDKECRGEYRKELVAYYRKKINSLCKNCKARLKQNPLRLLDCKDPGCVELKAEAPQMINHVCAACNAHFKGVLEFLDDMGIPYYLDPYLVRGLDYYSRTVFEIFAEPEKVVKTKPKDEVVEGGEEKTAGAEGQEGIKEGEEALKEQEKVEEEEEEESLVPIALAGGGRYDYLAEAFGREKVFGVGMSLGEDRIIEEIKRRKIKLFKEKPPQLFLIQLGPQAKRRSLLIFEELRKSKLNVVHSFSKDGLRSQLELANKVGAAWALIIGQKEALNETVIVRDMDSGAQETILQTKIIDKFKKRIKK